METHVSTNSWPRQRPLQPLTVEETYKKSLRTPITESPAAFQYTVVASHHQSTRLNQTTTQALQPFSKMYTSAPSILALLTLLSAATASPTTRRATQDCTPPSTIPRDIYNFSLRVDGSSEGQPELEINWEQPNFPTSPGHFILSTTEMTNPLLTFLNGNEGGKLCDQGDLCSDLGVKSGDDEFQSFSFEGQDQNALPAFQVSAPLSRTLTLFPLANFWIAILGIRHLRHRG